MAAPKNTTAPPRELSPEHYAWRAQAPLFGIPLDGYGKTVWIKMRRYTLTGINPHQHEFPVSAVNGRGEPYMLSAAVVRMALLRDRIRDGGATP